MKWHPITNIIMKYQDSLISLWMISLYGSINKRETITIRGIWYSEYLIGSKENWILMSMLEINRLLRHTGINHLLIFWKPFYRISIRTRTHFLRIIIEWLMTRLFMILETSWIRCSNQIRLTNLRSVF